MKLTSFKLALVSIFMLAISSVALCDDTKTPDQNNIEPEKYTIAIFPFLSSQFITNWWIPYHDYIKQSSQMEIDPVITQNFADALTTLSPNDHSSDFAIIPAHFYHYAVKTYHVKPVAVFAQQSTTQLVVTYKSQIHRLSDLKGKCIAFPDPLGYVTLLAEKSLERLNFYRQRDYQPVYMKSHSDTVMAVIHENCAAGITSDVILKQMNTDAQEALNPIVAFSTANVAVVMVAKATVPPAAVKRMTHAMLTFGKTPDTNKYASTWLYNAWRKVTKNQIDYMDKMGAPFDKTIAGYIHK